MILGAEPNDAYLPLTFTGACGLAKREERWERKIILLLLLRFAICFSYFYTSFHIRCNKNRRTRHHSEFSLSTIVIDARDALMINEERCYIRQELQGLQGDLTSK